MKLILDAFEEVPEVMVNTDLTEIILKSAERNKWFWENGDVIVLAQKIVSKAEGRLVNLENVVPSDLALRYGRATEKDPRLVELILEESAQVLRTRGGLIIVKHRLGFICANAGIDHSNVGLDGDLSENHVLLLPKDPDSTAHDICFRLKKLLNKDIGVMIIDSHGRPWRKGVVGISIGYSGVPGLIDQRGKKDRNNYTLKITEIAAGDELAAAASLMMGQTAEGRPIVAIKGFPYEFKAGNHYELIRPDNEDLFR